MRCKPSNYPVRKRTTTRAAAASILAHLVLYMTQAYILKAAKGLLSFPLGWGLAVTLSQPGTCAWGQRQAQGSLACVRRQLTRDSIALNASRSSGTQQQSVVLLVLRTSESASISNPASQTHHTRPEALTKKLLLLHYDSHARSSMRRSTNPDFVSSLSPLESPAEAPQPVE